MLFGHLRSLLRRALCLCPPLSGWDTPPPGWEVLPEDWVEAGNSFRRFIGQPPYAGPPRYPTLAEMEEWERAFPGSTETFRRCARICSEIRFLRRLRGHHRLLL